MTASLTDAQQKVLEALQMGARLLVSPTTALLKQEGVPDVTVAFKTWRKLYELDIIRREPPIDETHRYYYLYTG